MKTIKGPAIFLAQFAGDAAPFNTLDSIADWVAGLGYKGIQPLLCHIKYPHIGRANKCWHPFGTDIHSELRRCQGASFGQRLQAF